MKKPMKLKSRKMNEVRMYVAREFIGKISVPESRKWLGEAAQKGVKETRTNKKRLRTITTWQMIW